MLLRNTALQVWRMACLCGGVRPSQMGMMALALMLAPGLLPSLPSPAAASWRYDYQVEPNSPEAHFLNAVRNAKDQSWV